MFTANPPTADSLLHLKDAGSDTGGVALPDSFGLLAEWVDLLRANDLSEGTIHDYGYGLWNLMYFHQFHVHILEVTEVHIASYLASLGTRSTSKEHYAKGIRSFYLWAHRRGYLERNPVAMIQPKRVQPAPAVRFEDEEIIRLLIAAAERDPRRAWAILACLALGTRRTEFVSIRLSDIDWTRKVVTLCYTKGRRPREVDLGPWAEEAVRELMAWSDGVRLLPIEPNTLNNWVHDAVADAGLRAEKGGRRRTAHTLRATFVSKLLDEGIPPQVVGAIVGHRSLNTTSAYAAIGNRRTTKEAVQVFGPSHLTELSG